MFKYIPKNSRLVRLLMNIWPPFFFSGITLVKLDNNFKYCLVKLKNWPGTKNINGAQYGGSLFAMTDPVYSMMLISILGNKYYVWDKSAQIDFKKPSIGEIFFECKISDTMLENIYKNTANGDKYFPTIIDNLYDKEGNEVATVTRTLYIRLKPQYRKVS